MPIKQLNQATMTMHAMSAATGLIPMVKLSLLIRAYTFLGRLLLRNSVKTQTMTMNKSRPLLGKKGS